MIDGATDSMKGEVHDLSKQLDQLIEIQNAK